MTVIIIDECPFLIQVDTYLCADASNQLARAEFATLRLRLIKIAARVIETASRVRMAFSACHPEAVPFARLPGALAPLGP